MDTALNTLDPKFFVLVCELLARFTEARIPVVIVNTRRTSLEQADAVARKVSWVQHSKHQDGLAIDVCPIETYVAHGANKLLWDAHDPIWQQMGVLGETVGLRWGGRWKVPDLGHFEYFPVFIGGDPV